VLLEVDSPGGAPVAAEEIASALKSLGKPSVAWVRGSADSAAYWVASAADTVVASENSDVGSIGVTSSYVDNARQNIEQGLTYNQLVSGKYKDMGTTDRALTQEEKSLIQRDLDIVHENFIRAVSENRKLSLDAVRALADGSSMLGKMGKEKGLVDVLGTKDAVWQVLKEKVGDTPNVCW
jgi:protease-4